MMDIAWWDYSNFKRPLLEGKGEGDGPLAGWRPEHVGLYLDRCLPHGVPGKNDEKANRRMLYRHAVQMLAAGGVGRKAWSERWPMLRAMYQPMQPTAFRECVLRTRGRMLLHPSSSQSVTDGRVLLHHTYGVPYLPGSGLKGLARAQAWRYVAQATKDTESLNKDDLEVLFGPDRDGEDRAGVVHFLDALWVPIGPESPLALEVVTPHHSQYYTKENKNPEDTEDPVPTERLAIADKVCFWLRLEAPDVAPQDAEPWLKLAEKLLIQGLGDLGFSAWTASGFGRMEQVSDEDQRKILPPPVEWLPAGLSFNPGKQMLTATVAPGKVANAHSSSAKELLDSLPGDVQARLKANRTEKVQVVVEQQGKNLLILNVRIPG